MNAFRRDDFLLIPYIGKNREELNEFRREEIASAAYVGSEYHHRVVRQNTHVGGLVLNSEESACESMY